MHILYLYELHRPEQLTLAAAARTECRSTFTGTRGSFRGNAGMSTSPRRRTTLLGKALACCQSPDQEKTTSSIIGHVCYR